MINRNRSAIVWLVVSASAFVALTQDEWYTDKAVIPVKGDRPTVGFGSTFREDGSPVQMGDTITPPKALSRTLAHIQKDEGRIKQCVTAPLTQVEYNLMVGFAYQYGANALCASTIVREANAGNYEASCRGYLLYRKINVGTPQEYDCSTLVDGKPNKRCWGVWARSKDRYEKCMGEQA